MLKSFLLGVIEFRSDLTTNCGNHEAVYDRGRDMAHRLTLRRWDR